MARKYGCLTSFLVIGIVSYGTWVFLPRSHYAQQAQTLLQQTAERDRVDRELAKDTANNGYLNPTLLPLWGRKDIEFKPESEIQATIKNLVQFSDLSAGRETNLENEVKTQNTQVLERFRDFEKIYPEFRKAAHAKRFLIPYEEEPYASRLYPNLLGLRRVCEAATAYAEYLTLEGKADEALAVSGDLLALTRQIGQQQRVLWLLTFHNSLQAMAQKTAVMVLETSKPSDQALRNFAKELQDTQPDGKSIDQAMENELLFGTNSLDHLDKDPNSAFLTNIPGLVSREKRMYHNDYLPYLIARQKGETTAPESYEGAGFMAWFLGQRSFAGKALSINPKITERSFQLVRKRQGLIHLLVEMRLQKASRLQDLKDYKPLDGFDPAQVQVENGVIRYQATPEEIALWGGEYQVAKGLEKWSVLDPGRKEWVLHYGR